jgi:hypothetical protein
VQGSEFEPRLTYLSTLKVEYRISSYLTQKNDDIVQCVLKIISKPKRYLKVRDKLVGSFSFDIAIESELETAKMIILDDSFLN